VFGCVRSLNIALQSATDAAGAYLIDRSPEYFVPLLNYLRCGRLNLDAGVSPINVLEEARFYGIQVLDVCVVTLRTHTACRDRRV
jgi:hypothetical protein